MGIKDSRKNMSFGDKVQVVILGLITVSLIVSLIQTIERVKRAEESVKDAEKIAEKLKEDNDRLEERLKAIDTPKFIEQQVRDRLGYSKEGEITLVVPEDEVLRSLAPKEESVEKKLPPSNWEKWIERLF